MQRISFYQIKAAILDLDGTLIDSIGIWHEIDMQFFKEFHLLPPENISNQVNKMTTQEWANFFITEFHIPMTEEQIIRHIEEMAADYYANTIVLKPYVKEFLDFLDTQNIMYGIATATYRSSAKAVLSRLDMLDRMQFILTSEDVPTCKNTPDMFLQAAAMLHSTPEQTLVLEDSLHCIVTAKQANFITASVYDKHTPIEEWHTMQEISHISGENLQEILKLLKA